MTTPLLPEPVTESVPPPPEPGTDATAAIRCPSCGSEVTPAAAFCEVCGTRLDPVSEAPEPDAEVLEAPIELTRPVHAPEPAAATAVPARPCTSCGGVVGPDGYCETCGTKALSERDHYTEQPASWVAACCDKGVRHHRNEDAAAVAADPQPGSRAVLVVCDGVSTSADSDVASLAAVRAARSVLLAAQPVGMGTLVSRTAALAAAIQRAVESANEAVVAHTAPQSENPASCTFSAAVAIGDLIVFGNVGDSRTYWLPDPGGVERAAQLSVDDSLAQARMDMGVSRQEAETGPQSHAITNWLGKDSPDVKAQTGSITVADPGWLLVCSDGLWNYASEAEALQQLIHHLGGGGTDPLPICEALVAWANEQGGKDNITAALARLDRAPEA